MLKQVSVIFLLSSLCSLAQAQDLFFSGDLAFGGDKISDFDDGINGRAGGLIQFSFGKQFQLSDSDYILASLGHKVAISVQDETNGNDQSVIFRRFPLDLIYEKAISKKDRLGIGLSYHIAPKISLEDEDGDTAASLKLKNALGISTNFARSIKPNIQSGLKLSYMEYETKTSGTEVNGNNLAIFLRLFLK